MIRPITVSGASIYSSRTDHEGETKVTFCFPKSAQVSAALLTAMVERRLKLVVTDEGDQHLMTKGRFTQEPT